MTTITCPTCGAAIAQDDTVCPACGAPTAASVAREQAGAGGPHDPVGPEDPAGPDGSVGSDGTPPPPATSAPPAPGDQLLAWPTSEQRGWAIGAHLGGLGLGLMTGATFGFLAPLVIWLLRRDEDPFTDHHGKEALNFQLTVLLAVVAFAVLLIPAVVIGVLTLGIGLIVGALVVAAAVAVWIALPIVATVKASNGEGYRYPVTIRFVR